MRGMDAHVARVARELVCRELVRQAAEILAAAEIPVMPLKGALLARWVYAAPGERVGTDVDLLVPEPRFDDALRSLAAAGFAVKINAFNRSEAYARAPWAPVDIDLHRALFGPGRYRLPTADVFARGRPDRDLFGAPVILPDPLDAVAHAVGHAASDHLPETARTAARDVARIAAAFALDPARCARHLEATGLGRAARYTLGLCARDVPFAGEVLRRLRPDPFGALLAGAARGMACRAGASPWIGRAAGLLTNDGLLRNAGVLTAARGRHGPEEGR
jgi:hypothetical protein